MHYFDTPIGTGSLKVLPVELALAGQGGAEASSLEKGVS
jgi:hypothetical protein